MSQDLSRVGTTGDMRLRARALLLTLSGLALIAAVAGPAQARAHATRDGVVVVLTSLGYEGGAAAGTGMVLTSSGRVLTNNHVIAGATSVRVSVPKTGHTYTAHVVGYDVPDDVAVLQLDKASGLTTVTRESSSAVAVGDTVTAVGNAGGTGTIATAGGKVTRVRRTITVRDDHGRLEKLEKLADLIETSTHVEPGDSGGALLNSGGRVVGMI